MTGTSRVRFSSRNVSSKHPLDSSLICDGESELFYYRLLSEQAPDAILLLDRKGVILYANEAAGRLFQRPPRQLAGTPLRGYIEENSLGKALGCLRKAQGGVPAACSELNAVNKKGKVIPVEFTSSPISVSGRVSQIHATLRDISRRRQLEALVRESEKMEALQHFIAGTVRQIQHPLKGLLERSHALVEKYKNRYFEYIGYKEFSEIMRTLAMMRDQVRYCFDTTDRLLDLNRRKAKLKGGCCDVNGVLREVVQGFRHSGEICGVRCSLKLAGALPPAAIGPLEFREVASNIISNAVQSMPHGGSVRLRTVYDKEDGQIRIECRDDGIGIPEEIQPHIFEPFFTTKHRGPAKNLGLGLAITYAVVKAHRGEIVVKSRFRRGTLVQVYFPVYENRRQKE